MGNNQLSHVAFILDGNKRWAEKNNYSKVEGYKKGFENIKKIVDHTLSLKISNLTLFTLSSENFNRPSLNIIYDIIYNNFSKLFDDLVTKKNIKIKIFGSRKNLPKKIIDIFYEAENFHSTNNSLNLNIAFNYGFKDEITQVLKEFKKKINTLNLENELEIKELFSLGLIDDPDILIRTGGYKRLSNFIMYNLTYTELFFTNTLWPEFSINEYDNIIKDYTNISRKYGL